MDNRKKWIDILRALAIYFVVLGHLLPDNKIYHVITAPIKMPVFYLITGYLFKNNKSIPVFIKDLFFRLFIPWLIIPLWPLSLIKYFINLDFNNLFKFLVDFILGKSYWFVPSFFISQILYYVIVKKINNTKVTSIFSILMFAFGIIMAKYSIGNFWCMNTALTGVLFIHIGYLIKKYENVISSKPILLITCLITYVSFVIISLIFYPDTGWDFHLVKYYNIPICLILSITGIYILITLLKKIQNLKILFPLSILGQHTLFVYLFHGKIFTIYRFVFDYIFNSKFEIVYIITCSIIACIIPTIISIICTKHFPWIVGIKKQSKSCL